MPRHIKTAALAGTQDEADAKIRATVEGILADVAARRRGRARALRAVRQLVADELSAVATARSRACVAKVVAADHRRHQVRPGADPQFRREPARGAAAMSRSRRCPASCSATRTSRSTAVGCYVPGGRYPMVASAHMSDRHRQGRGRRRASSPARRRNQGEPHAETIAAMHLGGADEIYVLGGVQAVAAMALGTETIAPVDMLVGPGNAYVAEAKRQLSAGSASTCSPARPRSWSSPTTAPTPRCAPPTCSARPSTARPRPAILLTTSREARPTPRSPRSSAQLTVLPTADVAGVAWRDYGEIILVRPTRRRWSRRPTASPPSTSRC